MFNIDRCNGLGGGGDEEGGVGGCQLGSVSRVSELMNESFLLIFLPPKHAASTGKKKKEKKKAGWWRTSNADRDVKGGEHRRSHCHEYMRSLFGERHGGGWGVGEEEKSVFMTELFKDTFPCD